MHTASNIMCGFIIVRRSKARGQIPTLMSDLYIYICILYHILRAPLLVVFLEFQWFFLC